MFCCGGMDFRVQNPKSKAFDVCRAPSAMCWHSRCGPCTPSRHQIITSVLNELHDLGMIEFQQMSFSEPLCATDVDLRIILADQASMGVIRKPYSLLLRYFPPGRHRISIQAF